MFDQSSPFFDARDLLDVHAGGSLPHWHQTGKIQFVTFRLADSLPHKQVEYLKRVMDSFKEIYPEPWTAEVWKNFRYNISKHQEQLLHNGYGSCLLSQPENREILSNAIMHKNGVNYDVIAYVIMPNHVHMLIQLLGEHKLPEILHSIKLYSSRRINQRYNRSGVPLWKRESYDHIVRDYDELKHFIKYIYNNPRHFPSEHFELYIK